jgi:hypothetical protein
VRALTAGQLFFSYADADASPRGRPGLQTILETPSYLTPEEKAEVEARLFLPEDPTGPQKHLFFQTSSAKAVIASVVPLEGTDAHGRRGMLMAHALVVPDAEFLLAGNNPFTVLEVFQFFRSRDAAVSARTGPAELPPAEILCEPQGDSRLRRLKSFISEYGNETLRTLLRLAIHAEWMHAEHSVAVFRAAPAHMYGMLEVLFDILPEQARLCCSFDTMFTRAALSRTNYWAVGLQASIAQRESQQVIELRQGNVMRDLPPGKPDPFELWVLDVLDSASLKPLLMFTEQAYHLSRVLEGLPADAEVLAALEPSLTTEFLHAHQDLARKRISHALASQAGLALSRRILEPAEELLSLQPIMAAQCMQDGFPNEQVVRWLQEDLADAPHGLGPDELAELGQFARTVPDPRLALMHARWTRNWEKLEALLREASLEAFTWFVDWAATAGLLLGSWGIIQNGDGPVLVFEPSNGPSETVSADRRSVVASIVLSTLREHPISNEAKTTRPAEEPGLRPALSIHRRKRQGGVARAQTQVSTGAVDADRWAIVIKSLGGAKHD